MSGHYVMSLEQHLITSSSKLLQPVANNNEALKCEPSAHICYVIYLYITTDQVD